MVRLPTSVADLPAAIADLVLSRACAGCDLAGMTLCAPCWSALVAGDPAAVSTGATQACALTVAAWPYTGIGRRVILRFKEAGTRDLLEPLGLGLARSLATITDRPLAVVPVPPHSASRGERGMDVVAALARSACQALEYLGQPACVIEALRRRPTGVRQVGRSREERLTLSAGEFHVTRIDELRYAAQTHVLVIVDDVVTTGATLRAMQTCLATAGLAVSACAVIAAAGAPLPGIRGRSSLAD